MKFALRLAMVSGLAVACASAANPPLLRLERTPVAGGAELITFFEQLPREIPYNGKNELPLLAVLKTPGSDGSQLRQVWVFTYSPPSLGQRAAGAVPFLYRRSGLESTPRRRAPRPVFDMATPSRGVWQRIAVAMTQAHVIDPSGMAPRLTTRSYGGNLGAYRRTHIWEALDVIASAPAGGVDLTQAGLTQEEIERLQSRLQLSGRVFGGLVTDEALPRFSEKFRMLQTETRGHNWELLRQNAEENGLYFQPFSRAGMPASFAMIGVARQDLESDAPRRFDAKFLKIGNPFEDKALRHWSGYSETWDSLNPVDMIPLAVYSLDYPGVPLRLVDLRHAAAPKRAEMGLRFADEIATGVLGLTGFGNWSYLAAKTSWMFVHKRHGGTTNRSARQRAFVQLRHALGTDATLEPVLRAELAARVERLNLDPLERSWDEEIRAAWDQYEALMRSIPDPNGLPRTIRANREQEIRAARHGPAARAFMRVASIGTLGAWQHHDDLTPAAALAANGATAAVAGQ
jgi:hypothetical protein